MKPEHSYTHKIELLAPAGSYEGFVAAISSGADAVYAGGQLFGARAYANNFTNEQLVEAISTAHLYDRKLYLTVNTLLKNLEVERNLYAYLAPFYEAGLDAVLVQDFGVASFIKREFPELPIHSSTQMTVTGAEGMKYLESLGFTRIVPARELSLEEIQMLHKSSDLEIETFVHGALCYSFSGQCLMSSMFGGRSGNRGRCAQPCRLPYDTALLDRKYTNKKEFCPLSLKDNCTIDILPQIIDAGVVSLKIEGRMKQPSYAAGVTSIYRKYLDLLLNKGKESYVVDSDDRNELLNLFSRGGSCTGYYEVHNGPAMMDFTNQNKRADVASINHRFGNTKLPALPISGILTLFPGSPAALTLMKDEVSVSVCGDEVQIAQNRPMDEERIRTQMEKLGDTEFSWDDLDIIMDPNIFVPIKSLNELRRNGISELKCALLRETSREIASFELESSGKALNKKVIVNEKNRKPKLYVSCENDSALKSILGHPDVEGLYLPFDLIARHESFLFEGTKEIYLTTPEIVRESIPDDYLMNIPRWIKKGLNGILVRSLEMYAALKKYGYSGYVVLDHQMYTWNNEAVDFWRSEGILRNTVPFELNEKELQHRDNSMSEIVVYGYQPLMVSAQCIRKNLYGCSQRFERLYLKDRKGKEMPVKCICNPWKNANTARTSQCYNIIYNSIPFGLISESQQVLSLGASALRLSFTIEDAKQIEKILNDFTDVYYHDGQRKDYDFTKGHFKRGVE